MSFSEIKDGLKELLVPFAAFGVMVNGLYNTYIRRKDHREAKHERAEAKRVLDKVSVQSDGITEELMRKAAEVGHEKGLRHGREEGAATAATLEVGRQLGRDERPKTGE